MSISEKANDLLNKFCGAQYDYVVWSTQDNLVARDKARQEISDHIAELEAAQRWIPVTEGLPEANGWYLCGMVSFLSATFTNEIYFDAVNIDPRWNNPAQDRVYCWLDGVPELPEVQE